VGEISMLIGGNEEGEGEGSYIFLKENFPEEANLF
jgi:hypothetical protein